MDFYCLLCHETITELELFWTTNNGAFTYFVKDQQQLGSLFYQRLPYETEVVNK